MKLDKKKLEAEFKLIQEMSGDNEELTAENMVKFASDPSTEHHKRFPWDDKEAAHQHRLTLARGYIRAYVTILPSPYARGRDIVVPAFVSLPDHRGEEGGYEPIEKVMRDKERRESLLVYTIQRLLSIREVDLLEELRPVSTAIRSAAEKYLNGDDKEAA